MTLLMWYRKKKGVDYKPVFIENAASLILPPVQCPVLDCLGYMMRLDVCG